MNERATTSVFDITVASPTIQLTDGRGVASFTARNKTNRSLRAKALPVAEPPADTAWLSVEQPERDFQAGGVQQYAVAVVVPNGAAPGSYGFRLDVTGVANPDEEYSAGPSVAFEVPKPPEPPQPKFPWWIIIVVAAVILLVAGGVIAFLLLRNVEAPNVVGQPLPAAAATLASASLSVGATPEQVSAAATSGSVLEQNPGAGTPAARNSSVDLVLAIAPTPTPTPTPTPPPTPTPTPLPIVSTTIVGSTTVQPNGGFQATRVACPAGTVASGGGIDADNAAAMFTTSSGPTFAANNNRLIFQPDGAHDPPIGWQASARNDVATAQLFKTAAICARGVSVTTIVTSGQVPAASFQVVRAMCPSGSVAIGGGVDLQNVLTMKVTSSAPAFGNNRLLSQADGDGPAANGWQASARNEESAAQPFKVAAICASGLSASSVVRSTSTAVGGSSDLQAQCPSGSAAIGGGVDVGNVLTQKVTSTAPAFGSAPLLTRTDGANTAPSGWQASARNDSTATQTLKVAAICAR